MDSGKRKNCFHQSDRRHGSDIGNCFGLADDDHDLHIDRDECFRKCNSNDNPHGRSRADKTDHLIFYRRKQTQMNLASKLSRCFDEPGL